MQHDVKDKIYRFCSMISINNTALKTDRNACSQIDICEALYAITLKTQRNVKHDTKLKTQQLHSMISNHAPTSTVVQHGEIPRSNINGMCSIIQRS